MKDLIAHCGIDCSKCGAYISTVNNDEELRRKTAAEWRQQHNPDIKDEDVRCLGCNSDLVFAYCNNCEIRACSTGRSNSTCADCSDYSCSKLDDFAKYVPEIKGNLESIRK
jgi:hypothetical protein